MDIIIIAVCMLSLLISCVCLVYILKISRDQKSLNELSEIEKKISNLKDDMYKEFSRSRSEQAHYEKLQRDEISDRLKFISERIDKMTESNFEYLRRISSETRQNLLGIKESADRQSAGIEASLEKIRRSNEIKLDEMRNVVDEKLTNTLTQRLDSSFKTVSEQLEHLYGALGEMKEMSTGITDNVSVLNRVLTNVKARGTWAEVQLKNILDQTIPGMYSENFTPDIKSREQVEFAIKIPSGEGYSEITYLPIDSKFPVEDYIRLCDAADRADPDALEKARRDLENRIIHEAKEIGKYIKPPVTTPFAIMYLASEGLYTEIASSPNAIAEKLQTNFNIMIAGPTTITALLNSLSLGFKIAAINEKAGEVRKLLSAVKSQYDTFEALLQKARKKIDEAGRSLDDARHRNGIIQKKLKSVESVSLSESEDTLELLPDYENTYDEN